MGDGRWVAIACTNDRMFERLVSSAMEQPDLLERFRTMPARLERRDELDGLVQAWVQRYDAEEVLGRLEKAEVPVSLVYSVRDLFADPHVRARENIVEMANPLGGRLRAVGVVPRLTGTPGTIRSAAPVEVGAHNEEIYCGRLGLTREELDALRSRGIV
jgi:crotonobetainyl-CoA:carnitine CoA-transferase CaiB-like acyl-CoA transferase